MSEGGERTSHGDAWEQELERRVQARTRELREAKDALERQLVSREANEQVLRESEARYRLLAEYASDMISRHSPDGVYLYVSPSCRTMIGYEPSELIGKSAFDGIHPDDLPAVREVQAHLRGEGVTGPVPFRKRRRDGGYIWVEVTIRSICDPATGEPVELVAITRDVSERQKAEQELHLVQAAVKQIEEAVVITEAQLDRPGPRIEYVNPAFERMTGYTAAEVIGRTPRLLQGPRTSRAVLDRLRDQLARGEPFEGETVNYRKDGSEFILNWHIAPLRDDRGRLTHWVSIQRDVTEQKHGEQMARQRQAELAHVGRLSTMGEMASELAHELNQPLAAIVNYVQGATRRLDEPGFGTEELTAVLDRIAVQADRASQIIRRLRRFVRKREPQRKPVNVNGLVRDMIGLVEPEIRHQAMQVELELADDLPIVLADAVQVEQVLLNLVRNAIEAMEQSPPETRRLRIRSQLADDGGVQVCVIDQGPGIPDHQMAHIFEPFFTTKQRGMGMGLAISLSITEAHGGRLEGHHAAGGGMAFCLTLPLVSEADEVAV